MTSRSQASPLSKRSSTKSKSSRSLKKNQNEIKIPASKTPRKGKHKKTSSKSGIKLTKQKKQTPEKEKPKLTKRRSIILEVVRAIPHYVGHHGSPRKKLKMKPRTPKKIESKSNGHGRRYESRRKPVHKRTKSKSKSKTKKSKKSRNSETQAQEKQRKMKHNRSNSRTKNRNKAKKTHVKTYSAGQHNHYRRHNNRKRVGVKMSNKYQYSSKKSSNNRDHVHTEAKMNKAQSIEYEEESLSESQSQSFEPSFSQSESYFDYDENDDDDVKQDVNVKQVPRNRTANLKSSNSLPSPAMRSAKSEFLPNYRNKEYDIQEGNEELEEFSEESYNGGSGMQYTRHGRGHYHSYSSHGSHFGLSPTSSNFSRQQVDVTPPPNAAKEDRIEHEKHVLMEQMLQLQKTMVQLGDMLRNQDSQLLSSKKENVKLAEQCNQLADENMGLRNTMSQLRKERNDVWTELEFFKLSARSRRDKIVMLSQQINQLEKHKTNLTRYSEELLDELAAERLKTRKMTLKIKKFSKNVKRMHTRTKSMGNLNKLNIRDIRAGSDASISSATISSANNSPNSMRPSLGHLGDVLDADFDVEMKRRQLKSIEVDTFNMIKHLESETLRLLEFDQNINGAQTSAKRTTVKKTSNKTPTKRRSIKKMRKPRKKRISNPRPPIINAVEVQLRTRSASENDRQPNPKQLKTRVTINQPPLKSPKSLRIRPKEKKLNLSELYHPQKRSKTPEANMSPHSYPVLVDRTADSDPESNKKLRQKTVSTKTTTTTKIIDYQNSMIETTIETEIELKEDNEVDLTNQQGKKIVSKTQTRKETEVEVGKIVDVTPPPAAVTVVPTTSKYLKKPKTKKPALMSTKSEPRQSIKKRKKQKPPQLQGQAKKELETKFINAAKRVDTPNNYKAFFPETYAKHEQKTAPEVKKQTLEPAGSKSARNSPGPPPSNDQSHSSDEIDWCSSEDDSSSDEHAEIEKKVQFPSLLVSRSMDLENEIDSEDEAKQDRPNDEVMGMLEKPPSASPQKEDHMDAIQERDEEFLGFGFDSDSESDSCEEEMRHFEAQADKEKLQKEVAILKETDAPLTDLFAKFEMQMALDSSSEEEDDEPYGYLFANKEDKDKKEDGVKKKNKIVPKSNSSFGMILNTAKEETAHSLWDDF